VVFEHIQLKPTILVGKSLAAQLFVCIGESFFIVLDRLTCFTFPKLDHIWQLQNLDSEESSATIAIFSVPSLGLPQPGLKEFTPSGPSGGQSPLWHSETTLNPPASLLDVDYKSNSVHIDSQVSHSIVKRICRSLCLWRSLCRLRTNTR
jgi:hypothetical protein